MARTQRKKNEDALLLALASGATVDEAALQCEIDPRTVYRRLADESFAAQLGKLRGEIVARAAGRLTAAGMEAVHTLLDLQKAPTPPATRLGAARAILELGLRVREVVDLQQQLDGLETRLAEAEVDRQQPAVPAWNDPDPL